MDYCLLKIFLDLCIVTQFKTHEDDTQARVMIEITLTDSESSISIFSTADALVVRKVLGVSCQVSVV